MTQTNNASKQSPWIFIVIVIVVVLFMLYSALNVASKANRMEKAIDATYTNNQNILGSCTNKILEMAQVSNIYRKDLVEIVKAEMEGRYSGEKGKVVNFVQERASNYDITLAKNVQNEMNSCGTRFEQAQSKMIDQKSTYMVSLDSPIEGPFLGMLGFPKVDLDKYNLVLAEDTKEIFKEGKRGPIQIPRD